MGKAVAEGSTSVPARTDPPSQRRPRLATVGEEEVPRPAPGARAGQASATKRRRVAPTVAG